MKIQLYSDDEFQKIVHLRKNWLSSHQDSEKRKKIADLIEDIEYSNYSTSQRAKNRIYKQQVKEYIKHRIIYPNKDIYLEQYITEERIVTGRPKILFGTMEISNLCTTISSAFKDMKIEAYSIDFFSNKFGYNADLSRKRHHRNRKEFSMMIDFVCEIIAEFDIFNFFFCSTLLPKGADLHVYKELGKKTVIHYVGSDIRMYSIASRINPYLALAEDDYFKYHFITEHKVFHNLVQFSTYVDMYFTVGNEFKSVLSSWYTRSYEYCQPLDVTRFTNDYKKTDDRFLIVHAPSNSAIKGTKFIVEAINSLKEKYDFDFILVQNKTNAEAMEIYKKADLIIDQLILGWHGVFAVEAMALGKPVVCHICDYAKEGYPEGLPIINGNPDNIKEVIEWALNNKKELNEIGRRGREYVEEHHDAKKIAASFLTEYEKIVVMPSAPTKFIKSSSSIGYFLYLLLNAFLQKFQGVFGKIFR